MTRCSGFSDGCKTESRFYAGFQPFGPVNRFATNPHGYSIGLKNLNIEDELFLKPAGISPSRLAKGTGLSQTRISRILKGKRGIPAETALRFSRYFGSSPEYWLGIQAQCELAKVEDELKERIEVEVTPLKAMSYCPFLRGGGESQSPISP